MKLEEYLESLPKGIMSGEDVQLSDDAFKDIFNFIGLNENDVFYHLGCGDGKGVSIASKEYNPKKSIGIDIDEEKISFAKKSFSGENTEFLCENIVESDISEATVILFWFTNDEIITKMMPKFNQLQKGCKIITLWGPLPDCMPEKVKFPFILNQIPFKSAKDLKEQLLAVFGVKCVDFVTAWEHAERYTKAIELPDAENNRFVTIIQSLVIWISAKNLGVACGDEMPESIRTYIGILKNFYDIEVEHLLEK